MVIGFFIMIIGAIIGFTCMSKVKTHEQIFFSLIFTYMTTLIGVAIAHIKTDEPLKYCQWIMQWLDYILIGLIVLLIILLIVMVIAKIIQTICEKYNGKNK